MTHLTTPKGLAASVAKVLRRGDGPLTQELVQRPGEFGLGNVPSNLKPDATTTVVCGFCSTGCGLNVHLRDGRAVNLTPTSDYPVNLGMACPKGWEALTPLAAKDRATTPLLRDAEGRLRPVGWDRAMKEFTGRLKDIQARHGKDSVAFISTGQICTEEMALLGALAKFGMGMVHGDGNTRQCMATSVVAYKEAFGFDAPPFTYQDFEESDVLVFVGSNLCVAHPIMWQRVLRNRHSPEIIVVDPRKTETAVAATQHAALKPKTDLTLLYGLANLLIEKGWVDREFIEKHTTGFSEFAAFVGQFTLASVSSVTGLAAEQLEKIAKTIHRGKAVSFWWTMGVNQGHEAVRTAQAIINLALMTGNIGRPGTGANSITGQCNAMGSRLYSNTTNLIGGHDFTNAAHREKISMALNVPVESIPDRPSWAYDQIIQGIKDHKIKGLWVICTNPAHSWIDKSDLFKTLENLEFLVVQDMYPTTETAVLADLILPAAGWGEKDGTFINSERRIGLTKKVSEAPGLALTDFNIFKLAAHYWGCGGMFAAWSSPEAVFQIIKRASKGQPCEITGITDYTMLEENGGVQWPLLEGQPLRGNQRRLFEDGNFFTASGKARFVFEQPRKEPEPTDSEYPLVLLTGRGSSSQWHTLTRTDKSEVLRKLGPTRIYVEINPADGARLGLEPNQWVTVSSRRGKVKAVAILTGTVSAGQVFMPMHFAETNHLTYPCFDPYSRQPSYKSCAVRIQG